jgi:hypothetical protein
MNLIKDNNTAEITNRSISSLCSNMMCKDIKNAHNPEENKKEIKR